VTGAARREQKINPSPFSLWPLEHSIDPIGNPQSRNLLEILHIGRKEESIMHEGNGGNLEIHCANANALLPQTSERIGRLSIKQEHLPSRKEVN
jgi:hypothetical protein